MRTIRGKILQTVEDTITWEASEDLEPVSRTGWANQVTVYALRGLDARLVLEFDFQATYYTLDISGPLAPDQPGPFHLMVTYADALAMRSAIRQIRRLLEAQ